MQISQVFLKAQKVLYKTLLRVIPNYIVQGGDFVSFDGSGLTSIYGEKAFDDENFLVSHSEAGILSMARKDKPNTNGCQFFITCAETQNLDNKYVAFGKLEPKSMSVLRMIESAKVIQSTPIADIVITECGEM